MKKEDHAMKKRDLVIMIAKEAKITRSQANKTLDLFLNEISSELKKGRSVTATGFGTFHLARRKATSTVTLEKIKTTTRKGRLARATSKIEPSYEKIVQFKASKELASLVKK
jgi:nucleoid DNA-binding protein